MGRTPEAHQADERPRTGIRPGHHATMPSAGARLQYFPTFEQFHQFVINGRQALSGLLCGLRIALVDGRIFEQRGQFCLLTFQRSDLAG